MDNVSYQLLKLYSTRNQLSAQDIAAIANSDVRIVYQNVQYLADQKYLRDCIVVRETGMFNKPYQIDHIGRIALEEEQKNRRHRTFSEIRAWITLAIALAAFIKSFFF